MVRGKAAGKASRRTAWILALLAGLATATFAAIPAWAGKIHGKLQGTVDVPDASLQLPLSPSSSNVIITLFLGGPSGPPVPITITANTHVDAEDSKEKGPGNVVTFVDGDSVEVKVKTQPTGTGFEIVATKIELKNPQIEAFGAVDVSGSLTLPLAPGGPDVPIVLALGGVGGPALPIIVTSHTRVRGGTTLTLVDNDFIETKAVVQGGQVIALKIGHENQGEVEDEDE